MTLIVKLTPPSALGGADIELNAQRVDYDIVNDVLTKPLNINGEDDIGSGAGYGDNAETAHDAACRVHQVGGAPMQMMITGVFKSTAVKTATAFMNDLETALRIWWTYVTLTSVNTYPTVTWRRGQAESMLPLRINVNEDASNNPSELDTGYLEYLLAISIDTRNAAGYTSSPAGAPSSEVTLTPPSDLGGNVIHLATETIGYELSAGDLKAISIADQDESRLIQTNGAIPQIRIKGVFSGTDAVGKMNGLITAALLWWTYTTASQTDFTKYPQITWHSKTRYMLIGRLSIVDLAEHDGNELTYELNILIDSRSVT
jgi:hypothetical protein